MSFKKIEILVLLTIAFLIAPTRDSYAQIHSSEDSTLNSVLTKILKEFASEKDNKCDSYFSTLKISYGKRGKVTKILLSKNLELQDSANLLAKIKLLDVGIFESYAKIKKLKNIDMLIPLKILFLNNDCGFSNLTPLHVADINLFDDDNSSKKYFVFSGVTMISQKYK